MMVPGSWVRVVGVEVGWVYQQRGEVPAGTWAVQGLWLPQGEGVAVSAVPGDWYVVVDDVQAGQVILVIDAWPGVDAAGRLVFAAGCVSRSLPVARFQAVVDAQRAAHGQPAADRALRVGDVFWVRDGGDIRLRAPSRWQVVDVTGPARRAARAAQLVAASPGLRTEAGPASPGSGPSGGPGSGSPAGGSAAVAGAASPAV
jgi:hypothetical protein